MSKSRRNKKARKNIETEMNDVNTEAVTGETPEPASETASVEGVSAPKGETGSVGTIEDDPIAALTAERDEAIDQLLRARAEFDNYRKRTARETERLRQLATEKLMQDLLPVMDNFDLALKYKDEDPASLAQGVEMVAQQLRDVTARHGLETIDAAGAIFDPNVHEAVAQVPSDEVPADAVVEEFQRGYRMGTQILRPSKVTVSSGPPSSESEGNEE